MTGQRSILALVLPAFLTTGLAAGVAWHQHPSGEGMDALLAEVEVLGPAAACAKPSRGLTPVRITRLVKGQTASRYLEVRFDHPLRPEGLGFVTRRLDGSGLGLGVGERLFVVLRRDRDCQYRVEHFWIGQPDGMHPASLAALPTADVRQLCRS